MTNFLSPDNRDEWIGSSNGTRSCRFSWLKIILMALRNWTPSIAAVCKKRAKGKPPSKSDRVKITGSAFRQNNSTIWLPSRIFINLSLFDKIEKSSLNYEDIRIIPPSRIKMLFTSSKMHFIQVTSYAKEKKKIKMIPSIWTIHADLA